MFRRSEDEEVAHTLLSDAAIELGVDTGVLRRLMLNSDIPAPAPGEPWSLTHMKLVQAWLEQHYWPTLDEGLDDDEPDSEDATATASTPTPTTPAPTTPAPVDATPAVALPLAELARARWLELPWLVALGMVAVVGIVAVVSVAVRSSTTTPEDAAGNSQLPAADAATDNVPVSPAENRSAPAFTGRVPSDAEAEAILSSRCVCNTRHLTFHITDGCTWSGKIMAERRVEMSVREAIAAGYEPCYFCGDEWPFADWLANLAAANQKPK